jgi:hypothetical protein
LRWGWFEGREWRGGLARRGEGLVERRGGGGVLSHGFHEWTRMVSGVGVRGDLRFEMGLVRRVKTERGGLARRSSGEAEFEGCGEACGGVH